MNGAVSQFVAYTAFGETFVSQKRISVVSNYLFNSKEVDTETGLYYYGARYYNSKTSVWLSVDPIALYDPIDEVEHYLDGQHNGGYFNPRNTSVYGYTYQNPILYVDPNGKQSNFHTVKQGETTSGIAKRYNTTTSNIVRMNNLQNGGSIIQIGQEIRVPHNGSYRYHGTTGGQNSGRFDGVSAGVAGVNGRASGDASISMMNADAQATGNISWSGFEANASANMSSVTVNASGKYGNKNNVHALASGSLWSAEAYASGSLSKDGVKLSTGLGAYAGKGEITGGFTLGGYTFDLTVGGTYGSAHLGGNVEATQKNGKTKLSGGLHGGIIGGGKLKLELTIE